MVKFNGNLKLIISAIIIVGFIASIGAAWAYTNGKADKAYDKAETVEEKYKLEVKRIDEKLGDIKIEQRAQGSKLDRMIEHWRIPAKK